MERQKGALSLIVSDTGVGLPEGFDIATATTLGLKLASTALGQLRGTISVGPGPGAAFRMHLPERVDGTDSGKTRSLK